MARFVINNKSKYKAVKTEYKGRKYDSKREAAYAQQLDLMKKAKGGDQVVKWTPQVVIPLKVRADEDPAKAVVVTRYIVDFVVEYLNGRVEYHEVKGFETDVWRLKKKLFQALYPQAVLKVIR